MLIRLAKTDNDRREMPKIITDVITIEGTLREETSIINPEITIEIENPSEYNYMQIPDFHRTYFINDVVHVRNDLWRIVAHVDVLATYANEILHSNALIDKTGKGDYDKYIDDGTWLATCKTKTDIIPFSSGLSETGVFLLMAAGG